MTELRKLLLIANAFTFTTAETVQVAAAATINLELASVESNNRNVTYIFNNTTIASKFF